MKAISQPTVRRKLSYDYPLAFLRAIHYNNRQLLTLSVSLRERCRHRNTSSMKFMGGFSVAAPIGSGNFCLGDEQDGNAGSGDEYYRGKR